MSEFSATLTVSPVPVVTAVVPNPNVGLIVPGSATITLKTAPQLPDNEIDTFLLTFESSLALMTFNNPPITFTPGAFDGITLSLPPDIEEGAPSFELTVTVNKALAQLPASISTTIQTSLGSHDPSIAIDPPGGTGGNFDPKNPR